MSFLFLYHLFSYYLLILILSPALSNLYSSTIPPYQPNQSLNNYSFSHYKYLLFLNILLSTFQLIFIFKISLLCYFTFYLEKIMSLCLYPILYYFFCSDYAVTMINMFIYLLAIVKIGIQNYQEEDYLKLKTAIKLKLAF